MSSLSSTGSSARGGSPPPPMLLVPGTPSAGRSTEEIWKDINVNFLKEQEHHSRRTNLSAVNCFEGFPGGTLCESFPGMNREPGQGQGTSPVSVPAVAPADPATCLSLYWAPANPSPRAKRPPKPIPKRDCRNSSANEPEDKRRKRLMKNRESADRSRARKQAYTNELENEIAVLRKENAWLRSQQEKMWSAAPPGGGQRHHHHHPRREMLLIPQKMKFHRTLTAPF